MNCWRIGSNWGSDNLLDLFKENAIAFAGSEIHHLIKHVQPGDYVVITDKTVIRAIGQVKQLIQLGDFDDNIASQYDDVLAIQFNTLYFSGDFQRVDFGTYGARGVQFHQARHGYIDFIKKLYKSITHIIMDQKYPNLLLSAKNLILTGPPGTGKTFLAKKIAENLVLTPLRLANIEETAFNDFKDFQFDAQEILQVDEAWNYWRQRIMSTDFNLDDYANTVQNTRSSNVWNYGGYLMNFLERTSSKIYGSSKPGNAYNYGIKMNGDHTYGIGHSDERFPREVAELKFEEEIKPWLQGLLKSTFEKQIEIVENGNHLIRAGQLMRKIVLLEHPSELLCIYQDRTIANAYRYFANGSAVSYFEQNKELLTRLFKLFKLERNKENQFKLVGFVWHYFNINASGDLGKMKQDIIDNYLKTYTRFVQFHPSYDYTDFMDGLRPVRISGEQEIGFELKNGAFKEFCKSAKLALQEDQANNREVRKFIFIIDEINRAEISRVFGELFFALDPGYRGEKGKLKTQYANIQNADTCYLDETDDYFYVPENVYIIGTMNDIDRSVESFDFAMRRRFAWAEISALERINMWEGQIDNWKDEAKKRMISLNQALESTNSLNSSYHIGPAYFLKLEEFKGDFQLLWDYHIGVVVQEYLRGLPNSAEFFTKLKYSYDQSLPVA